MYVNDLDTAKEFFVSRLGGVSNQGYHNEKTVSELILYHLRMELVLR